MAPQPSGSALNAEDVPIWKCGDDPFKYPPPLPKKGGDHWNDLLTPLLERDKEQCDAWKEEIKNLLIFAGLFTNVVTAFVIVSYQGLQADPNQAVIALLSQIATTLDKSQNGTSAAEGPIPLLDSDSSVRPSSAISRVNVLWFASVVLSLTVALGGIVGLQWLREYRRSTPRGTSQESFAYFNMRSNGLEEWYVPQIFSMLPVLLLLALILFLIGLVEFLLLNTPFRVSAPIIAITGLPIIFIILTTILPSFEWVLPPIIFFQVRRRIPAQCPYKSPQSFLSRRILSPMISFLLFPITRLLTSRNNFQDAIMRWQSLLKTFPRDPHRRWSDMIALYYREVCHEELYLKKKKAQFPSSAPNSYYPFLKEAQWRTTVPALYDLIEGLKNADRKGSRDFSLQAACYQCVLALATQSSNQVFKSEEECHQYIQSMLQKVWPDCEPHVSLINFNSHTGPAASDREVLLDETRVSVLRAFNWDVSARSLHGHELHIRLMHYHLRNMGLGITLTESTRKQLLYFWRNSSPVINNRDISKQYTCLLRLLFTQSAVFTQDRRPKVTAPFGVLPHPHLGQFVETACLNQEMDDILSTIQLIKDQTDKLRSSSVQFNPSDQYLLIVLMASYIGTVRAISPQISSTHEPTLGAGNVNSEEDFDTKLYRLLFTERNASERVLMEQSVLYDELHGYSNFHIINRKLLELQSTSTSTAISMDHSRPASSFTGFIQPTNCKHAPIPTTSVSTNQNQVAATSTDIHSIDHKHGRSRVIANNHSNPSTHPTFPVISVVATTSSKLEEMFPGERIPPPPSERRLWSTSDSMVPEHSQLTTGDSTTPEAPQTMTPSAYV